MKLLKLQTMPITRAHVKENERNKKLYKQEFWTRYEKSDLKASDCQYFLAFRLTSNDKLLHNLRIVQDEYVAKDSSLCSMLEPLEKKAHIPLNIIRCDETRLDELKKLISETVEKHKEKLANPPEIEVKALVIEYSDPYPYHPISVYARFRNKSLLRCDESWFFDFQDLFEDILNKNGFETFYHSLSERITLFRRKSGHKFEVERKCIRPYAKTVFGELTMRELSSLHLCSMKSSAQESEDGFYHIEQTFDLNFK